MDNKHDTKPTEVPAVDSNLPTEKVSEEVKSNEASKEVATTKSKSQLKREAEMKKAEEAEPQELGEGEEVTPEETEVNEDPAQSLESEPKVSLRSADGRKLEASIGDVRWEGKEIFVPQSQAGDVRRMLEGAGYYLKD